MLVCSICTTPTHCIGQKWYYQEIILSTPKLPLPKYTLLKSPIDRRYCLIPSVAWLVDVLPHDPMLYRCDSPLILLPHYVVTLASLLACLSSLDD